MSAPRQNTMFEGGVRQQHGVLRRLGLTQTSSVTDESAALTQQMAALSAHVTLSLAIVGIGLL